MTRETITAEHAEHAEHAEIRARLLRALRVLRVMGMAAIVSLVLIGSVIRAAQRKDPSISSGWVKLPAAGATSTEAYVSVDNPTQYDFYLQSTSSDGAGSVEIRESGKDAAAKFVTVPAYGTLDMDPKGVHLLLKDLKKPLAEGDKIQLTVVTDGGLTLNIDAAVRKTP